MTEATKPAYYAIKPTHPEVEALRGLGRIELFRVETSQVCMRFLPPVEQSDGLMVPPSPSAVSPLSEAIIEGVSEEVSARIHDLLATYAPEIIAARLGVLDEAIAWLTTNLFKNEPKDFSEWDHVSDPCLPKALIEACLLSATNDNIPATTEVLPNNVTRKLYVRNQNHPLHPPFVQNAELQEKKIAILVVDEIIDDKVESSYFYSNLTDGQPIKPL